MSNERAPANTIVMTSNGKWRKSAQHRRLCNERSFSFWKSSYRISPWVTLVEWSAKSYLIVRRSNRGWPKSGTFCGCDWSQIERDDLPLLFDVLDGHSCSSEWYCIWKRRKNNYSNSKWDVLNAKSRRTTCEVRSVWSSGQYSDRSALTWIPSMAKVM